MLGIELNEYAAELARVSVWIGELQWRIQRGYGFKLNQVLEPLEHIECRDALLNAKDTEAGWPSADAVVGNPPFVGDKKMRGELGADDTKRLRVLYVGRVPGGADFVCYWFEKARAMIAAGALQRAGLVSTNSIRGGRNREVLDRICSSTRIFEAWSDERWINNGAAVRVSLTAFGSRTVEASPGRPTGHCDHGRPFRCERVNRRRSHQRRRFGRQCQDVLPRHPRDWAVPRSKVTQPAHGWRNPTRTAGPTAMWCARGSTAST